MKPKVRRIRTHWRGFHPGPRRCYTCRKGLLLEHSRIKPRPNSRKAAYQKHMAEQRRMAIRCLDCRLLFCPRCAKKHFLPQWHVHAKVMRAIDAVVTKALRGLKCKAVRAT